MKSTVAIVLLALAIAYALGEGAVSVATWIFEW